MLKYDADLYMDAVENQLSIDYIMQLWLNGKICGFRDNGRLVVLHCDMEYRGGLIKPMSYGYVYIVIL